METLEQFCVAGAIGKRVPEPPPPEPDPKPKPGPGGEGEEPGEPD
jgi:hypothetical protein